jgi:hypothetical protein
VQVLCIERSTARQLVLVMALTRREHNSVHRCVTTASQAQSTFLRCAGPIFGQRRTSLSSYCAEALLHLPLKQPAGRLLPCGACHVPVRACYFCFSAENDNQNRIRRRTGQSPPLRKEYAIIMWEMPEMGYEALLFLSCFASSLWRNSQTEELG